MPRIGTFEFPLTTLVDERTELVLGRIRKVVKVTLVLEKFSDKSAYEAALSDLEEQVEKLDRGQADLSIHPGRFLSGRRRKWGLVRQDNHCMAVAFLEFLAEDRFERSETENTQSFSVTQSPQSFNLNAGGNWNALPVLELTANASLSDPSFSDGTRTLSIDTDLVTGDQLVIDSESRTVSKNGTENLLGQTTGDFPELTPNASSLDYSDNTAGNPSGTLKVTWRDRWV